MHEKLEKRWQFGLASLFAAMTLASLALWARSLWWIPAIWAATFACGMVALAIFVAIVRILLWAGVCVVRWGHHGRDE
jgi:hypothetical protein